MGLDLDLHSEPAKFIVDAQGHVVLSEETMRLLRETNENIKQLEKTVLAALYVVATKKRELQAVVDNAMDSPQPDSPIEVPAH